ncbi:uncharacterized protein CCOS01_01601 [Colletotrichum costaricense]|uniref:Uncharacterized protein n=1 Tax=Colletotrichum costaricense TaxID=1209916 RepID=A0AAJ0E785_9PEZI|nr:uncharacterized protein CCOS01_01601 [Colletotrichum costaricense]KAI3532973.1 hypothetical protein CSPX01_13044 [Colletotrichum filicis]KAK1540287.1 hypothetical protein CCOS01_01601 [Colletotrichum costaricense]
MRSPARNLTPAPDSQPPPNLTEWVVASASVARRPPRQTTAMNPLTLTVDWERLCYLSQHCIRSPGRIFWSLASIYSPVATARNT